MQHDVPVLLILAVLPREGWFGFHWRMKDEFGMGCIAKFCQNVGQMAKMVVFSVDDMILHVLDAENDMIHQKYGSNGLVRWKTRGKNLGIFTKNKRIVKILVKLTDLGYELKEIWVE